MRHVDSSERVDDPGLRQVINSYGCMSHKSDDEGREHKKGRECRQEGRNAKRLEEGLRNVGLTDSRASSRNNYQGLLFLSSLSLYTPMSRENDS